jgi:hypothetical protein
MAWKEWREQRWRLALGAITLTVISASLVRAQLVTTAEAQVIVFGPLGLVLSIFMAMGPVPPEKAEGTWHFLTSKPMRHGELMIAKWATGAIGLVTSLVLAGIAAYFAARSRGLFDLPRAPEGWSMVGEVISETREAPASEPLIIAQDSPQLLLRIVITACAAFLSFYSLLFVVMNRARSELHAGLAGILATIVVIAWASQFPASLGDALNAYPSLKSAAYYSSLVNPLCPLFLMTDSSSSKQWLAVVLVPMLWAGLPILHWMRRDPRALR